MRRSILSTLPSLTAELFGVAVAALHFSEMTASVMMLPPG
jgi:NO-binding membrane sensor protein with MHYT domain